ncbi:MAG: hypothetical protein F6J87_12755 [Spirulina sp. SIO3F2]|nr:hypothetical protein [Spirulina sp. SIO3F2]
MSNSVSEDYSSAFKKMQQQITYYFAAWYLMDSSFPSKDKLPPGEPLPFTTFGHEPLVDNKLFHEIVWSTIESIQNKVRGIDTKRTRNKALTIFLSLFITSVSGVLVFHSAESGTTEDQVISTFAVLGIFFVFVMIIGIICELNIRFSYNKKIAEIRYKNLKFIKEEKWDIPISQKFQDQIKELIEFYGSGRIDEGDIPVVISQKKHPFPGFGRLQAENTFTCPPTDKVDRDKNIEILQKSAWSYIKDRLIKSGIKYVSLGEVLAVQGHTIPKDSVLLGQHTRPELFLCREKIKTALEKEKISARIYYAVDILFPKYMTKATFFLRFFNAGNGISCHLAVSTMGSPVVGKADIDKAILKYEFETTSISSGNPRNQNPALVKPEDSSIYIEALKKIKDNFKEETKFQKNSNLDDILSLCPSALGSLSSIGYKRYENLLREITQQSTVWPGASGFSWINKRERHSLTFTSDFFGRPESIASVSILYSLISKAVIDSLEDLR